ncbi:hypothetical protein EWB00_006174, partial [Schistosoma japonicum]
ISLPFVLMGNTKYMKKSITSLYQLYKINLYGLSCSHIHNYTSTVLSISIGITEWHYWRLDSEWLE